MDAPVDLDIIKDDLGIAADDTTNDAWLQRRVNGIWSRFQEYTGRPLMLSSPYADDWGLIADQHRWNEPPNINPPRRASVYLNVFPVQSITKCTINGAAGDPAAVRFDALTGKLFSLDAQVSHDLGPFLLSSLVRIEYMAGFDPAVPSGLYEALIGALSLQWGERSAASSGLAIGGMLPKIITAIDVGTVELGGGPNAFVDASNRRGPSGGVAADPLLGPYTTLLDPYVAHRLFIGGTGLPITTPLGPGAPLITSPLKRADQPRE